MQFLVDALAKIKPGKHWKTQAAIFMQMVECQEILFHYPLRPELYSPDEYNENEGHIWIQLMAGRIATAHRSSVFTCHVCGQVKPRQTDGGTGYAVTDSKEKICYNCASEQDRQNFAAMKVGDKGSMYLCHDGLPGQHSGQRWYVQNWTGQFKISVHPPRIGRHNIANVRYDVWFRHAGNHFHGVTVGENTQICHITCIKPS